MRNSVTKVFFFLVTGHIDTICLVHTKILDSKKGRKVYVQHKLHCLSKELGTMSHSHQLGNVGTLSEIQVPRHWPKANFASRPS